MKNYSGILTSENIGDVFWKIAYLLDGRRFTFIRKEGENSQAFDKQKLIIYGDKNSKDFFVSDLWSRDGLRFRLPSDVDFLMRTDKGLIFGVSYDFWSENGKYDFKFVRRFMTAKIFNVSNDSEKEISWHFFG